MLRDDLKLPSKRICIKLSSLAVTNENGGLNGKQLNAIVKDISHLVEKYQLKVVIVCSGAINMGRSLLKSRGEDKIEYLQAASALGQPILTHEFSKRFQKKGIKVAQVLLTHEDFKSRSRSLNTKQCLDYLLQSNIIPIINENDTVSFNEITLGDNDQLSAMTCELLNLDLLCMLTKTDGLYTDDPSSARAKHLKVVEYDDELKGIKLFKKSSTGRGGMKTKIFALRKLTPIGIPVIISSFEPTRPLIRVIEKKMGTFFKANTDFTKDKKKAWILTRAKANCAINIDQGAYKALKSNASLLIVGVRSIRGNFFRGDCVSVYHQGRVVAHGIVETSSGDIAKRKAEKTKSKSNILIHKNNLTLKL